MASYDKWFAHLSIDKCKSLFFGVLLAKDLVCYGCTDTQRGGDCQSNSKGMLQEAQAHMAKTTAQQNVQSGTNYVKRCNYDNFTYCVIETIENRGKTLCCKSILF